VATESQKMTFITVKKDVFNLYLNSYLASGW